MYLFPLFIIIWDFTELSLFAVIYSNTGNMVYSSYFDNSKAIMVRRLESVEINEKNCQNKYCRTYPLLRFTDWSNNDWSHLRASTWPHYFKNIYAFLLDDDLSLRCLAASMGPDSKYISVFAVNCDEPVADIIRCMRVYKIADYSNAISQGDWYVTPHVGFI